jgi:hypothetical protein
MANTKKFTGDQARQIGDRLGIDWNIVDLVEFPAVHRQVLG